MAIKVIFTLSIFAGGGRRVDMKLSELQFCNSKDSNWCENSNGGWREALKPTQQIFNFYKGEREGKRA
jgi:hypothetical protein